MQVRAILRLREFSAFGNADTAFGASATYKREMWNIVPMNPACVDDSSLTQLFSAPHDDYADTQSLSTYIMLTMCTAYLSPSMAFF